MVSKVLLVTAVIGALAMSHGDMTTPHPDIAKLQGAIDKCIRKHNPSKEAANQMVNQRIFLDTYTTADKCFWKCLVVEQELMVEDGVWNLENSTKMMNETQKSATIDCIKESTVEDKCDEVVRVSICLDNTGLFPKRSDTPIFNV